jgi:hypothetical protein
MDLPDIQSADSHPDLITAYDTGAFSRPGAIVMLTRHRKHRQPTRVFLHAAGMTRTVGQREQ